MEVSLDVPITLTRGVGARQFFVFVGNVIFSCSIARKNISRLLNLWRPHKDALILDLIRFKEVKNSSIYLFFTGMELEVTLDVPITLTGGDGARQSLRFMGFVLFL